MHEGNRCWQIMTSRPRVTVNQQTRWTRKIQRKAFPTRLQPSTDDLEEMEAHVLAHSSERVNSDSKENASKSGDRKTEAQCSCYLPQKTKRDLFCEQKRYGDITTTVARSSAKDVNLETITDTLSWYKFFVTQWNPCQDQDFTRDVEEFAKVL